MTVKEAVQNINNVLTLGRIIVPNGPLTREEHIILQQSLGFLEQRANEVNVVERKAKEAKE